MSQEEQAAEFDYSFSQSHTKYIHTLANNFNSNPKAN
jgi:hypothetical protein